MARLRISGDDMRDAAKLAEALRREARKRDLPLPVLTDGQRGKSRRHRQKPPVRAARATWRVSRWVTQHSYARRRPLAPFAALILLPAAGVVLHLSPHGPTTVPLVALTGGLLIWWRSRRRKWRRAERIYAGAAGGAAYGWMQAAAVIGVAPPMPGVFGGLWLAAAVPWWWHHRIRAHDPDNVDARAEMWAETVGAPGAPLPGSRLRGITPVATGWSATIVLPGGKLTTDNAIYATKRIASAFSKPATSVIIEPMLTAEEDQARLLVLDRNPLQEVQWFTGPRMDLATGQFPIGLYADGTTAYWRLFRPGSGACHGLIAGTTDSGKSTFVNLLCTEIRHSGVAVLWLADPEEGCSVPDWQDHVDWFAGTPKEIRRMLQAAERVMKGRKHRRGRREWIDPQGRTRRGVAEFNPTPEEPLLFLVVDESPDVLADPECVRIIGQIGKKGRKLGVGVIVVAQVPSVSQLGGDGTVRSMLASMNIVMFRTSDRLSARMGMPKDLAVDPKDLPEQWPDGSTTAGLGYVASGSGRVSSMRGQRIADPFHWATCPAATASLDEDSAADAGEDYATWRDRRDDDGQESASAPVVALRAAPAPEAPEKTTIIDACLAELRECGQAVTTGALAARVARRLSTPEKEGRAPLPTVSTSLARLKDEGHVVKVTRGLWAVAASERRIA